MRATVLALIVATLLISCGGGSNATAPLPAGSLVVKTTTLGNQRDPNGYSLSGSAFGGTVSTGIDSTIRKDGLPPGTYPVTLGGLASNCHAPVLTDTGHVVDAGLDTVAFAVTCDSTFGTITISNTTTGGAPPALGFTIQIDGIGHGNLPANDTLAVGGVLGGIHVVGISGLPSNCSFTGPVADTVLVLAGASTPAPFGLSCPTPPAVRIFVSTAGPFEDPDGYTLTVDGALKGSMSPTDTLVLTNLVAGTRTIGLRGIVMNCTALGDSTTSVGATLGDTVAVTFSVSCTPPTLVVDNNQLSTGYDLFLVNPDGSNLSPLIVAAGTQTSPQWIPGTTQVLYVENPENGGSNRHWSLIETMTGVITPLGVSTDSFFSAFADPSGTMLVGAAIGDTTTTYSSSRLHRIALGGTGRVRINQDSVVPHVARVTPNGTNVVFEGQGPTDSTTRIYVVPLSGGLSVPLTALEGRQHSPAISPSGDSVVFARAAGLSIMAVDGSGERGISSFSTGVWDSPSFDPTGTFVAAIHLNAAVEQRIAIVRRDNGVSVELNLPVTYPTTVDWRK